MQHLEVSGAVRPLKWSLGVKWLRFFAAWHLNLMQHRCEKSHPALSDNVHKGSTNNETHYDFLSLSISLKILAFKYC